MNKKNNNKSKLIIGIILFVIIIICAVFVENSNTKINNNQNNNIYTKLNIDKAKLNVFYLNVGQADSTLITMGEDVMLIDAGNKSDGDNIVQF